MKMAPPKQARRRCSLVRAVSLATTFALAVVLLIALHKTSVVAGFSIASSTGTCKRSEFFFSASSISSSSRQRPRRYEHSSSSSLRLKATSEKNPAAPFSSDELVALTKEYLANPSPDWWSDDFVFRGPVIGPLTKRDLIETLGANSEFEKAFPDLETNAFGFAADDPIEPNRVWWLVRPRGTFAGPFTHPTRGVIEPTGAEYVAPPEVRSVVFNDRGKIKYQTVGYVADRFTGDTTGGRGAVFGQYAVMGEKLDPNPGSWSLLFLQKLSEFLPGVPKSYSKPEDVPAWWTDTRKGAEL